MNTNLIVRKQSVLTLAVLAFLLAAAVLLTGLLSTINTDSSLSTRQVPNPRVRFAPLGGHRYPSALEGGRRPAALEGKRTPAALDGWRSPAALEGRKPPAALEGGRKPAALDGKKIPPAALEGRKTPSALSAPSAAQSAPLTLVDGLILLALAALLLAPARKASPVEARQERI